MQFPNSFDSFHHSYIVEGMSIATILNALSAAGFPSNQNPDISILQLTSFGIKDARSLRERALLMPVAHTRQCFIIETARLTHEAQNALLKTLEEPSGSSVFFILVPNADTLLPTLISRSQVVRRREAPASDTYSSAFLKAPVHERLDMIADLLPKSEHEEKDLGAIMRFLSGLELQLAIQSNANPAYAKEGLKALYRAKKYCMDKGASHKMLLEQTALLVPRIQA